MATAEALRERIAGLREAPGFRNYERVRALVLPMLDAEGTSEDGAEPSSYWREELRSLDYLLDASPLVIDRLRHHTHTVTGIRPYDYRTGKTGDRDRLAQKLAALIELGGRELLVPEPALLGGFGHEIDGALYNIDTLKFYEALIALERGAVLGGFRDAGERRVVWEIGAGWGGFAYQFKTLFPDVTYVVVDLPELFLFSATYLMTAFPAASTVFATRGNGPLDWLEADFVFVPHTALELIRPPRLDLTVNMVSFQEMTTAQVERYVRTASSLGSPFLYSLNRDRSRYNDELESVTEIIDRYYWPYVVPVLPVSYLKMLDVNAGGKAKTKAKPRLVDKLDYKHIVATRRIAP